MALSLTAYLNERFQFTYNVANFAALYANLAAASWIFQIRPAAGSPVVTLDFRTGGSPQNLNATILYRAAAPAQVIMQCPASALISIAAGAYSLDFGFILPGADFERVDGGSIQFTVGVTVPPAAGTPPPPTGSDDTVLGGANPTPVPIPVTLDAAISAANSSALAAQTALTTALSAQADATASKIAAAASATAAAASATLATTGGLSGVAIDTLTVTGTDVLSPMSMSKVGNLAMLIVRGQTYLATATNPKFTIVGTTVTWNAAAAGYSLSPGDDVSILYSH